jgi:hypothetical protein
MTPSAPNCLQRLAWAVLALICLGFGLFVAFQYVARPWYLNWGMNQADLSVGYPSDAFVANPERLTTRGITIQAPIEQVWPWVVQIGADRGGFYTYSWLEGAIACPIHNAGQIHPEWQNPQPGDSLALCPKAEMPPPYEVITVEPGQALVLGHRPTTADNRPDLTWFESWAFILQPIDANATRLIIRSRSTVDLGWMKAIEPGVFIMEYGMLHGIQARAEGAVTDPSEEMLYRLVFAALFLVSFIIFICFRFIQAAR